MSSSTRPISRPPNPDAEQSGAPTPRPERKQRGTTRSAGAFAQVSEFMSRTGYNDSETAKLLGYAPGAINHWRKSNIAPVVAGLAAECLVRRLGMSGAQSERSFAFKLSGPATEADAVLHLLAKLGVKVKEL